MKTIITHSGSFHADDIFAVATLLLIYPDAKVIRTRDQEEISRGDIVVDVGGIFDSESFRFDHHQKGGAGERKNGIPYASFGLVWNRFGEELAGKEGKEIIEDRLVSPIDASDSGVTLCTPNFPGIREFAVSDFLYSYVSSEDATEEELLNNFLKLAGIAKDLLTRLIEKAKKEVAGREKTREIVRSAEDKRIIILEEELPWMSVIVKEVPESLYVIYKRREGNWGVKAVPKEIVGFELRKRLPESWRGKAGEELIRETGVNGAVFCHNAGFLIVALTKEEALELARKALNS